MTWGHGLNAGLGTRDMHGHLCFGFCKLNSGCSKYWPSASITGCRDLFRGVCYIWPSCWDCYEYQRNSCPSTGTESLMSIHSKKSNRTLWESSDGPFLYIEEWMKNYPWGKTKPRNFQDDTAQSIYIIGWLLAELFSPQIQHLYKIYFMPTARKVCTYKKEREPFRFQMNKFILISRPCPSCSLRKTHAWFLGNLRG